jgi:hypothetical protein
LPFAFLAHSKRRDALFDRSQSMLESSIFKRVRMSSGFSPIELPSGLASIDGSFVRTDLGSLYGPDSVAFTFSRHDY